MGSVPHVSENFADLLDPRFERIFFEEFDQVADKLPDLFTTAPSNGRADQRWSEVADFGDWDEFTGQVNYQSVDQGFDTIATHVEFASGFQIRRKLFDDDQYNIMDGMPAALGRAQGRTRQKHGARLLNNAFSVDNYFAVRSEGVALCSDSHSSASGASTTTGFDNLTTSAISATALTAARNQFIKLKSDNANIIDIVPDEIWYHPDQAEVVFEILASRGKPDTATNARNFNEGAYTPHEWLYLSDVNNWFLADSGLRRQSAFWIDRVAPEFAMAEDLDTLIGKWRGYTRYSNVARGWRWILGANVS